MDDDDAVFRALADPTRRLLLDRLYERDGRTLSELVGEQEEMTRFGVMKHLRVLESAGLVALLHTDTSQVVIHLEPLASGTLVQVSGTARLGVRRAVRELGS